jgi:hypothetical protein
MKKKEKSKPKLDNISPHNDHKLKANYLGKTKQETLPEIKVDIGCCKYVSKNGLVTLFQDFVFLQ